MWKPVVALPGLPQQSASVTDNPRREVIRVRSVLSGWTLLGLAMGTGAYLRLWQLDAFGFNSDEAVYAGQAAAIASVPGLVDIFPVFRAHPLLFQFLTATVFSIDFNPLSARLLSVAFGVGTIVLAYLLGQLLYGRTAGFLSASFVAVMPYHVVVTRQVLLDGPMVFFATLSLYLLARFGTSQRAGWLIASSAALGLAVLTKETAIILVGSIYAFIALAPEIRIRLRDIGAGLLALSFIVAAFPLSIALAGGGGSKSAGSYLVWQLFRRPNHEWTFYPTVVPSAVGLLLLVAAIAGLWLLRREGSWRERMLLAWVLVPVVFFQLWPTKGFQYLLPAAIPMAVLAARLLARMTAGRSISHRLTVRATRLLGAALIVATFVSLAHGSWLGVQPVSSDRFLAGSGGVSGGREAGEWIRQTVPAGARLVTIGPSMANILQFYGYRPAFGLSVSPNPLRRNPSYQPVLNPDLQIRNGDIQYLVWDAFSAARSSHFADVLLAYVERYSGTLVHEESVVVRGSDGRRVVRPVIQIYRVHP
jgi:hypothetical protein